MQSSFFVPFVFDENTLAQQVLEPTTLTATELDGKRRELMGTLLREAHAVQLRIRDYKHRSPYHRVYATNKVDPHYEAWIEEHVRLLQSYLQTQYPHLFAIESEESHDCERHQRVIVALSLLLERVRIDRSALELALNFAEYDGERDPFQGGLCRFL